MAFHTLDNKGEIYIMRKKTLALAAILLAMTFTGCGEVELETPEELKWEYSEGANAVYFTWEEVENATGYEIDYGEGYEVVSVDDETAGTLSNPVDGITDTVKVRAICEKNSDTYYSEWASVEYTVPVYLGVPTNLMLEINGKRLELAWDEAKGATSYEIYINVDGAEKGDTKNFSERSVFKKVSEGESGEVFVRSVRTNEAGTHYSEWISAKYSVPVVDFEKIYYSNAFLLDYNKLLQWVDYKGYSYEISEEVYGDKSYIVVDVSHEDKLNSGFWNTVGRVIGTTAGAFLDGYVEETYDSYTGDFESVENTLATILSNDSVKGYVNDVNESAKYSGAAEAIVQGLDVLFLDTDIHYVYYYENDYHAAKCSVAKFLKVGREKYKEEQFGHLQVNEEGLYEAFSKNLQQSYLLSVEEVVVDSYDYWMIISSK